MRSPRPSWKKVPDPGGGKKIKMRPPQDYLTLGEYHEAYMAAGPARLQRTAKLSHEFMKIRRAR